MKLSRDLTEHDLQTVSIPYDILRAQMVKAYGDASGLFSEAQLALQGDDEKAEEL